VKILLVADLHARLRWFDWLSRAASDYNAVGIAGDFHDLCHPESEFDFFLNQWRQLTGSLREQGAAVLWCTGNHEAWAGKSEFLMTDRADYLWLESASDREPPLLISWVDWGEEAAARLDDHQRLHLKKEAHWLVLQHNPPPGSILAQGSIDLLTPQTRHAIHWKPDYLFGGHLHGVPFAPKGNWLEQIGPTWAFNPGQVMDSPFPCHLVLDTLAQTAEWRSPARTSKLNVSIR
jgi:Icc-related predicted phosphoesterase